MATLTKGKTFANGELVTPQKLHELVDLGTVSGIVNADISASAAIADTKLAQITTANKVAQSAVTNLTSDLAGKAAASHTHDDRYYTETEMNTLLAGKQAAGSYAPATGIAPSAITGTAVITTDSRLSDARTPTSHTHDDRYYTETEVNTLLAGKQAAGNYASTSHTHFASDITTGTFSIGRIPTGTNSTTVALGDHTHDASKITSGTLANARTTATSYSFENYVSATGGSMDTAAWSVNLINKIVKYDAVGDIHTYGLNTFGVTSYSPGANSGVYSIKAVSNSGAALVQTYIGGILSNSTNTGVIYGTASDYRLKTNIEPLTGALARLLQIPVHRFNWLADPSAPKVDGFLAHEAQAVVPESVTGRKDEVDAEGNPIHQGIDQSKLVPLLFAAVQELAARVAALEAR